MKRPQKQATRISNALNSSEAFPSVIIQPSRGWVHLNLRELWEYRELLYFLVWRDIKVRYKQTVLGGMWAIIQPLFTMIVFALFFGELARISSDGVPYPIFSYAALVPWFYYSNALNNAANSLVGNTNLVSKVYFPRLILPTSPVAAGLVDFLISLSLLFVMMFYYGIAPTPYVVVFPLLTLLLMMIAAGTGMWLAALNAQYRDVRYAIPFLVQFWMFASPIAYPSSLIPQPYRAWYGLNPMAGIIEGFRSILIGTVSFPFEMLAVSAVVSVLVLVSGAMYFRRMERSFADVI